MAQPVVTTCVLDIAASPEEAWPLLTDTDRTNRYIGSAPVKFQPIESDAAGTPARFIGTTRGAGFEICYEEAPFEWSYGRSFSIERIGRGSQLARYLLVWKMEPLGTGTRVTIRLELSPRLGFLRPVAWFQGRKVMRRLEKMVREIDAHVKQAAPNPFRVPIIPSDPEHLARALTELKRSGVDAALADRLAAWVKGASDADVARIRPFEVADAWLADRREVLRAFLRAVPAGLVELRWGLVCPSCLTASAQLKELDQLSTEGHCQLCDISFDLDLDRAVEATFVPHPSVRPVPDVLFCIGGPSRTPHVLVQANLPCDDGEHLLDAPPRAGRYRFFARGGAVASLEVTEGAPAEVAVTVGESAVTPHELQVRPGGVVRARNQSGAARHVKIERLDYANAAATCLLVSTMGDFRTLFSTQLLKRGTPLKVAQVTILFSDLTGSTALYSRVGDAAAFRLVDDHFDVLRRVVEEHEGVVVKTMGDALLAGFTDAGRCVRAALECLARFEAFRAAQEHGDLIGLKLGLFTGACYVVTANNTLDYFGQTVNVASRVQHVAETGELVLPAQDVGLFSAADRARITTEPLRVTVKGVDVPLDLLRVRLKTP